MEQLLSVTKAVAGGGSWGRGAGGEGLGHGTGAVQIWGECAATAQALPGPVRPLVPPTAAFGGRRGRGRGREPSAEGERGGVLLPGGGDAAHWQLCASEPGGSLTEKKKKEKKCSRTSFPKKARGHSMCSTMVGGGWRLAVGGGWRLAVGNWRLVAAGGGWRRLVVGDRWLVAVGSGWQLAVGRRWRLAAVGGWRLMAVGG